MGKWKGKMSDVDATRRVACMPRRGCSARSFDTSGRAGRIVVAVTETRLWGVSTRGWVRMADARSLASTPLPRPTPHSLGMTCGHSFRGLAFDDAVDDGALGEELPFAVGDTDVGVDDFLAALEDAALGEDLLADGAGEVVDVDADSRAEVAGVAELRGGPGGHRAGGVDEGGDGATVEGIAHSGVFFLVGEAQLGVALGALDELDAELGLVRDEGCSSGDAADALFG